jgi:hypothetical protein
LLFFAAVNCFFGLLPLERIQKAVANPLFRLFFLKKGKVGKAFA